MLGWLEKGRRRRGRRRAGARSRMYVRVCAARSSPLYTRKKAKQRRRWRQESGDSTHARARAYIMCPHRLRELLSHAGHAGAILARDEKIVGALPLPLEATAGGATSGAGSAAAAGLLTNARAASRGGGARLGAAASGAAPLPAPKPPPLLRMPTPPARLQRPSAWRSDGSDLPSVLICVCCYKLLLLWRTQQGRVWPPPLRPPPPPPPRARGAAQRARRLCAEPALRQLRRSPRSAPVPRLLQRQADQHLVFSFFGIAAKQADMGSRSAVGFVSGFFGLMLLSRTNLSAKFQEVR